MLNLVLLVVFCFKAYSIPVDRTNVNQIESSEVVGDSSMEQNMDSLSKNNDYVAEEGNEGEVEEMNSKLEANADEPKECGKEGGVGSRSDDVGGEEKYEGVFGGEVPEENGHSKREKRFEPDSLDLSNLLSHYDDNAAKYDGVFGGYPQDNGLGRRVKRS
uniref:Uncharacterized protein n=1 Tax=Graphocephala atropunctata TaxID=36148 RepID=A0A1B6L6K6_9HEMI